jgi:PmbA protein
MTQELSYTPESLEDRVHDVIAHAVRQGASGVQAIVSHSVGLSVNVRRGEIETLEHERDQQLALVAYFGQSKGTASTTDFSLQAMQETAEAACRIARHTEPDPYAGMPDASDLAREWVTLDLDHPWDCSAPAAIALARAMEEAGFAVDGRVDNSEGASVSSRRGISFLADSQGFCGGYASTRHSLSCALVARDASGMQRDYAWSVARRPDALRSPVDIGTEAGMRALRRLGARKLSTRTCPVLFLPEMARGLIGNLTRALAGGAQYRRQSFLLDAVGRGVFPATVRISEDPFLPQGLGSAPFDAEGVRTRARDIVADGVIQSYILDSYSARRLGLKTTGNAGGARNLMVHPTPDAGDLAALLRQMGEGLCVTELIGQGVNLVTGDYSRGAVGFWVENGELAYPVEEVTIAGQLSDMFGSILAVGNDVDVQGNIRTGSILIEKMTVAGS